MAANILDGGCQPSEMSFDFWVYSKPMSSQRFLSINHRLRHSIAQSHNKG